MSRENIINHCYELLKSMRSVRLGKVERDPIIPEELARTAFPAAYFETADEEITEITYGLRTSVISLHVNIYVSGQQRDTQRNTVVEAIEKTLMADRRLGGLVSDIALTNVETINLGEAAPYASYRLVFTIEYCYNIEV